MTTREQVTQAVFTAVETVNRSRPPTQRLARSLDAALMGEGAVLDSLGMVNLIVAIEEELEDALGVPVSIADEPAQAKADGRFRTVGSLVDYLMSVMERPRHG